jgi:hypothetical protein
MQLLIGAPGLSGIAPLGQTAQAGAAATMQGGGIASLGDLLRSLGGGPADQLALLRSMGWRG